MSTSTPPDRQASTEILATVVSEMADDPIVHAMSVGFVRELMAGIYQDFLTGDRKTRMDIARVFLAPVLRDAFSKRGGRSEQQAALAKSAMEMRELISGILPDDDHA
jgi:hypothetical protein